MVAPQDPTKPPSRRDLINEENRISMQALVAPEEEQEQEQDEEQTKEELPSDVPTDIDLDSRFSGVTEEYSFISPIPQRENIVDLDSMKVCALEGWCACLSIHQFL